MKHHFQLSLTIGALVVLAFANNARAGSLIIDDAVFAHDFENISGNAISALRGPDATKTSNIIPDMTDLLGLSSTQHVQAPNSSFATINTNTRLLETTSKLSFSIFYNDRGDNGGDNDINNVRFLSSFNGTGFPPNETIFGLVSPSGNRLPHFSVEQNFFFSSETIPFKDATWHQAGFVFDSGTVTFYFDGSGAFQFCFSSPFVYCCHIATASGHLSRQWDRGQTTSAKILRRKIGSKKPMPFRANSLTHFKII